MSAWSSPNYNLVHIVLIQGFHRGSQEFEERVDVSNVILDRRTGKTEGKTCDDACQMPNTSSQTVVSITAVGEQDTPPSILGLDGTASPGRFGRVILDDVRLIKRLEDAESQASYKTRNERQGNVPRQG